MFKLILHNYDLSFKQHNIAHVFDLSYPTLIRSYIYLYVYLEQIKVGATFGGIYIVYNIKLTTWKQKLDANFGGNKMSNFVIWWGGDGLCNEIILG